MSSAADVLSELSIDTLSSLKHLALIANESVSQEIPVSDCSSWYLHLELKHKVGDDICGEQKY